MKLPLMSKEQQGHNAFKNLLFLLTIITFSLTTINA
jgi:hypothetical protein